MQSRLSKVIFITGTSSGIGRVVAQHLSSKGYKVYGSSRNPKAENSLYETLKMDVREVESVHRAVDYIIAKEGRIDVLINNAGVGITGAMEEIPQEAIWNNFETNCFGPIELIKAVLPTMRNQKSGLIINVTSIAGYMGLPYRSAYSASKAALHMFSESLRIELKPFDIQVTTIAPGDFATDIATRRFHTPIDTQSPYYQWYKEQLATINDDVNKGSNPQLMADRITAIIEQRNPKVHYKVGRFLQKLSILLKHLLPDTWYEKLLMHHYNIKEKQTEKQQI